MTGRVAIAALVVPALVLVAMTARSYQPFGGDAGSERAAPSGAADVSFTFAVVLGVVLVAVAVAMGIYVWILRLRASARQSDWEQVRTVLAVLLVAGLTALALGEGFRRFDRRPAPPAGEGAFPARPGQRPVASEQDELARPEIVWPLVIAVGALLVVALLVMAFVIRRRRRSATTRRGRALAEIEEEVDETIDDLRHEPDPRKAVIAAYARMERVLSKHGVSRKPAEAPYEYLARTATELDADNPLRNPAAMWATTHRTFRPDKPRTVFPVPAVEEPMRQLTALFEEAKFSEHAVGEAMRGRAIDALIAVRAEVRAAT